MRDIAKIYAFLILIPFVFIIFFKGILFYEFNTKQRYLKDLTDNLAYKVKITGTLTVDEYSEFKNKINELSKFNTQDSIVLKSGTYVDGNITNWQTYPPGITLTKGNAFLIYIKSSEVSTISRIQNGGISVNDLQNLYFSAKSQCRIEYNN